MSFETEWNSFLDEFRAGLAVLVKNSLDEWKDTARADAEAYLEAMKDDLPRWAKALKEGLLTKDEFEQLLQGQKSLLKLHMLTAAGLSKARLERFRVGLISLVTNSAYSALGL